MSGTAVTPGRRRIAHVMSMPVVIDVRDAGVDEALLGRVVARLEEIEAIFSVFRRDSQVSRINRGDLGRADADPEVREVLDRCDGLRDRTDGFFDARRPDGTLDPSGYVKGWAIGQAEDLLTRAGMRDFAVNAGGDMALRGGACRSPTGGWASSIRRSAIGWPPWRPSGTGPWPHRGSTRAAGTSWIRTRAGRPRDCCR